MERKNPVNLRLSDAALAEMAGHEGFVPYAYDDKDPKPTAKKTFITPDLAHTVEGTLTKGFGHTRTTRPGDTVTREQALSLFRSDAREAESCVHRFVTVPLTQGEFDGMVDLFFNVGPGRARGTNGPDDPGRDGIAILGKTGNGRPSTILSELNKGNYDRAAECFTQWRSKGTIWEWGLLQRRLRFMLIFMGLPIARAMTRLPNAMPPTDQGRYELQQACVALAREEAEDAVVTTPAKPAPEPQPELVLTEKAEPEVKPAPPPVVVAPPPPPPLPPPPKLPDPPIPIGQQTSAVDATHKADEWSQSAKSMIYSRRFWGLFLVVCGRVWMLKTGSNVVLGAVSDPLVMEMFSGFMVMAIGEIVQHWGERKATRPLK